jgi:hypothetical protein
MLGIETISAESFETPPCEVWPDHLPALNTFLRCVRQWRTESGKVLGLDYNVVFQVMDRSGITNQLEVLDDVAVIEKQAVELLNKKTNR